MPTNTKQLRSMIGSLSYYRNYLPQMAKRIRSLTGVRKKNVKFDFTPAMAAVVRELLDESANPPVLLYPDWDAAPDGSRPFRLCCDATIDGFGATLEQEQPDGSICPLVNISRATLISERQWTPLDLEAGSIVWCLKRLRGHLWGLNFHIYADHEALEHFARLAKNVRVLRWLEFLTAYNYTLEYRKGSANGNADFLSRLPIAATETDRSGRCRLTPTDDDDFVHLFHSVAQAPDADTTHLIRSCGYNPIGRHALGARLDELLNAPPSNALGGLPPSLADFANFRDAGPRADASEPMMPGTSEAYRLPSLETRLRPFFVTGRLWFLPLVRWSSSLTFSSSRIRFLVLLLLGAHARYLTRDKQFLLVPVAARCGGWPTSTSSGLCPCARAPASTHTTFRGCCSPVPPFDDTFGPGFPGT